MLDERFVHLLHMFMFFVSRWRGSKKFEDWEGGSQNLELGLVADLGGGGEGGRGVSTPLHVMEICSMLTLKTPEQRH